LKARFVFEKFTEDSDPIKDMDIGYGEFLDLKVGDVLVLKKRIELNDLISSPPLEGIVVKPPEFKGSKIIISFALFTHITKHTVKWVFSDIEGFIKFFTIREGTLDVKTWKEHFRVKKAEEYSNYYK